MNGVQRILLAVVAVVVAVGLVAAAIGFSTAPIQAEVPGGPVKYQCGGCGQWNDSEPPCPGNCDCGCQGTEPPPPPPARDYGVVTLANRTSATVEYWIRCFQGGGWSRVALEPGRSYFHWYRPSGNFQLQFTANGKTITYNLDVNIVRGRTPTIDDGRYYAFESGSAGFDLHTAQRPPPIVTPPPEDPNLIRQRQALSDEVLGLQREGEEADKRGDSETALARFERALELARSPLATFLKLNFAREYYQRMVAEEKINLGSRAWKNHEWATAKSWLDKALQDAVNDEQRTKIDFLLWNVKDRLEATERAQEMYRRGEQAGKDHQFGAQLAFFEASLALIPEDATAQENVRIAKEAYARSNAIRDVLDNDALERAKTETLKTTENPPLNDQELALMLGGEFQGKRSSQVLDDPELATLLAGEYESARQSGALDGTALSNPLEPNRQLLAALSRRGKEMSPLSDAEMVQLNEAECRARILRRHALRIDEATRIMSREWSREMRKLEASGMISPTESVLLKEQNDPAYAAALRAAKDKVWAYYLDLKKIADEEARKELYAVSVVQRTNPYMAADIVRAEIANAWGASVRYQAAQSQFDHQSVVASQALIDDGTLKRGVLLAEQLKDPKNREVLEQQVEPIREKLWKDRKQILRDFRDRVESDVAAIVERYRGAAEGLGGPP